MASAPGSGCLQGPRRVKPIPAQRFWTSALSLSLYSLFLFLVALKLSAPVEVCLQVLSAPCLSLVLKQLLQAVQTLKLWVAGNAKSPFVLFMRTDLPEIAATILALLCAGFVCQEPFWYCCRFTEVEHGSARTEL